MCASLAALPSIAQQAPPGMQGMARFAGTVTSVTGNQIQLKSQDGGTMPLKLGDSARIMTSKTGTIADLAAGKFVGCTAVKKNDGKLHATECHIFPESMRGAGEGHNPMGPPNTTMTNGNITTMTNGKVQTASGSAAGAVIKVAYKGGAQDIEVSPDTHVTSVLAGDASMVKPGTQVMGAASREPDGSAVIQFLNVAQ
jgi:hypothetical protein